MCKPAEAQLVQRRCEIALRIRQLRRQKRWTQQQVADLLGCSRKRYNTMEQGQVDLRVTELDFLAKTFGVPVAYFFEQVELET